MALSKIDKMKLIGLMKDFSEMCSEKDIKFNRYSEEELMEFLMIYKAWKTSGEPPF